MDQSIHLCFPAPISESDSTSVSDETLPQVFSPYFISSIFSAPISESDCTSVPDETFPQVFSPISIQSLFPPPSSTQTNSPTNNETIQYYPIDIESCFPPRCDSDSDKLLSYDTINRYLRSFSIQSYFPPRKSNGSDDASYPNGQISETTNLKEATTTKNLHSVIELRQDQTTVLFHFKNLLFRRRTNVQLWQNGDSALHVAAANGQIEILSTLLDGSVKPDVLNSHKQTPLMLAAMHGKISCVKKLLEAGANLLMFDSLHGRTYLHYAAYYGHSDCLQAILSAAQSSTPVTDKWELARFVNVRDFSGAMPLHLAALQRQPECVHILLDNGALVCASTSGYGTRGRGDTPLHLAARGGSLDCIRELLAWGADRIQRDTTGRIPYTVALNHYHEACAAILNPSSAEPLVWPSPLKFISELNQEAKALLQQALMDANREWEKNILKGTVYSLPSPAHSDIGLEDNISEASDSEQCCMCFEQVCTIEVQDCGHQMCAQCTLLALCCHNKPNPTTAGLTPPVCPFCQSTIARLVVAKNKCYDGTDRELGDNSVRILI